LLGQVALGNSADKLQNHDIRADAFFLDVEKHVVLSYVPMRRLPSGLSLQIEQAMSGCR
jgi:hypothetical protein